MNVFRKAAIKFIRFIKILGPGLITGGNTLSFTGPGQVAVVAAQAGDADWKPAAALTNTCQVKNNQTITFAPIGTQIITNILKLNATASSGLPVTFTVMSAGAGVVELSVGSGTYRFTSR